MRRSKSNKIATKTNPQLWERLKKRVIAGSKGGSPGSWSARKAQLLVKSYKDHGGRFVGRRSKSNSLTKWTKEKWDYVSRSGRKSKSGRYLPEVVRRSLSPSEKARENRRKGSKHGKWVPYSASVAAKMRKYKIV